MSKKGRGKIIAPTCTSVTDVMTNYPDLTYFGFGGVNGLGARFQHDEFIYQRERLEAATPQIEAIRSWIRSNCEKRRTINTDNSSFRLRPVIERGVRDYVSGGMCIVAFILEGYRLKRHKFGPNCCFNVKILKTPRIISAAPTVPDKPTLAFKLTKEQQLDLAAAARPLIKWMRANARSGCQVKVNQSSVVLTEEIVRQHC